MNQHIQTLTFKRDDCSFQAVICFASIPLAELQQQIMKFLHQAERDYFNTLTFARRQQSYLLGHWVAKHAIASLIQQNKLSDILIEYGVFHFPIIQGIDHHIHVSYSHSGQLAVALAFPEAHPLGIDLELRNIEKTAVIESQLTSEEKQMVSQASEPDKIATLLWTVKEALSKVLKTGMMTPFTLYAVHNVQEKKDYWSSEFIHFNQYKTLSFAVGPFICSIVYPKKSQMIIDIPAIQTWAAGKLE